MESSATSNVYIHVIEDVISKVRDEFINNGGPGVGVLDELKRLWERKMIQAGAILGPVHDLNVAREGTEECETPTADLLSPPIYNHQGVVSDYEDCNIVNTPLPNEMLATTPAPAPAPAQNDAIDDDDDDLDDVGQGEDLNPTRLGLALFDKVTRTKSKWKCTLKDGIMQINNKDILFNKANGEFYFC